MYLSTFCFELSVEKRSGDLERMACQALLGLRNEEDGAKEVIDTAELDS